jgi:hypothetical protein
VCPPSVGMPASATAAMPILPSISVGW